MLFVSQNVLLFNFDSFSSIPSFNLSFFAIHSITHFLSKQFSHADILRNSSDLVGVDI